MLMLPGRAGGGHSFSGGGGGGGGFSGGGLSGGGSHFIFFGGGGGGGGIGGILVIFLIVAIGLVVLRAVRSRRDGRRGPPGGVGPPEGGEAWMPPGSDLAGSGERGWSHDDRPAIDTVRGDLFPGSATEYTGSGVGTAQTVGDGIGAIVGHDPGFDREAFLDQAQRAFFVVQEAWTECKPEMSRQVMADSLWQQHRVQIKGYADQNKHNIMGDLAVGNMDIVTAHSDASYDTITVRIRAACSDYDVDNDSGKVVRGNRRVQEWTEDWTFQRSAQATTLPGGGTLSQKCPNCGAPLNVDLAGVCPYCQAPVMSGAYDWVLARISQLPGYG